MARKFGLVFLLGLVSWFTLRRWLGRAATAGDLALKMAGDDLIVNPTHSVTEAITVEAPPAQIWPWLVQMGSRRGGLYSIDWLDRLVGVLDRPSADRILPEFQHLAVGDKVRLGPREELTVEAIEPERALVLAYRAHGMEWVWQFGLFPLGDNRTRLVSRGTERLANTLPNRLFMLVMDPASLIMTRRMLQGLKRRAEAMVVGILPVTHSVGV